MMIRKIHQYPPFYYLALITVSHEELMKVVEVTEKISVTLFFAGYQRMLVS